MPTKSNRAWRISQFGRFVTSDRDACTDGQALPDSPAVSTRSGRRRQMPPVWHPPPNVHPTIGCMQAPPPCDNGVHTAGQNSPGLPDKQPRQAPHPTAAKKGLSVEFMGVSSVRHHISGNQTIKVSAFFSQSLRIHPAVLAKGPTFRLAFPIRCAKSVHGLLGQEVSCLATVRLKRASGPFVRCRNAAAIFVQENSGQVLQISARRGFPTRRDGAVSN